MNAAQPIANLMSGDDFRESLRRYKPRVFLDGKAVASVADEPGFAPGINAIALTYDYALKPRYAPIMTAVQHTSGKLVNRLTHINTSSGDLLNKLEAVRLVCQETGCAQRYCSTTLKPWRWAWPRVTATLFRSPIRKTAQQRMPLKISPHWKPPSLHPISGIGGPTNWSPTLRARCA